jgi:hypothetical protein
MAKHTLTTVSIELGALRSDIAHILEVTAERAEELEVSGRAIFDAIAETARTDPAAELRDRAARLRGGARHAMAIATEIESMAGRLDGLALARRMVESEGEMGAEDRGTVQAERGRKQRK